MATLRETLQLTRLGTGSTMESGGFPTAQQQIDTVSVRRSITTQIVGTTEEVVAYGDLSATECLAYMRCLTDGAEITYGTVVSATYYPIGVLNSALGYAKLGIVDNLANLYVKSDTADTEVEIVLHEITEAGAS